MHKALLYEKLPNSRVRCHICQWRCLIGPGKFGVCRMYQNQVGTLINCNYAQVSSIAADPIEKKPLFHFYPGTLAFSLGGWGCNFHCSGCQNWEIACPKTDNPWYESQVISPRKAIELATYYNCQGIAWTYNEPTVWFEYTLDSAKLAKESNLYTVYVTNGYITTEALDTIGPYLDAWRVDIKGFSDVFYRKLAKISNWREILSMAQRAKVKWRMHVEVITNIIPTMNDDDRQLEDIAIWIKEALDELTPWHITRFHPNRDMIHLPPTPLSTLEHAYDIGKKAGLKFVYIGNVPGHKNESTVCYSCGKIVIDRVGYQTRLVGLKNSKCQFCNTELNIMTTISK